MKKNSKILLLLIVIVSVITISGCQRESRSAYEVYHDSMRNQQELESFEFIGDVAMEERKVDMEKETFSMFDFSDIELDFSGKVNLEDEELELNFGMPFMGMTMTGKLYINDEMVAIQSPFITQGFFDVQSDFIYILIDELEKMEESPEEIDEEELGKMMDVLYLLQEQIVTEELLEIERNIETTLGEEEVKLTKITLSINEENYEVFVDNFVNSVTAENIRRDIAFILSILGMGEELVEFNEFIDDSSAIGQLREDMMEKQGDIEILINLYIDNNDVIVKNEGNIFIENGTSSNKFNYSLEIFNIDSIEPIVKPNKEDGTNIVDIFNF